MADCDYDSDCLCVSFIAPHNMDIRNRQVGLLRAQRRPLLRRHHLLRARIATLSTLRKKGHRTKLVMIWVSYLTIASANFRSIQCFSQEPGWAVIAGCGLGSIWVLRAGSNALTKSNTNLSCVLKVLVGRTLILRTVYHMSGIIFLSHFTSQDVCETGCQPSNMDWSWYGLGPS